MLVSDRQAQHPSGCQAMKGCQGPGLEKSQRAPGVVTEESRQGALRARGSVPLRSPELWPLSCQRGPQPLSDSRSLCSFRLQRRGCMWLLAVHCLGTGSDFGREPSSPDEAPLTVFLSQASPALRGAGHGGYLQMSSASPRQRGGART